MPKRTHPRHPRLFYYTHSHPSHPSLTHSHTLTHTHTEEKKNSCLSLVFCHSTFVRSFAEPKREKKRLSINRFMHIIILNLLYLYPHPTHPTHTILYTQHIKRKKDVGFFFIFGTNVIFYYNRDKFK